MASTLMNAAGLNRTRSAVVFLVNETSPGTIAASPIADNSFGLTTTPVIGQAGNYTDTSEIGAELISVDRVLNYMEYSTFDFEYYAKPAGVVGTPYSTTSVVFTSAASATNVVTVTQGALSVGVGDTITVSGVDDGAGNVVAAANGTFMVTSVDSVANTFEYKMASTPGTPANSTVGSINKAVMDWSKTPEHDLLTRTFGGVKYMSAGKIGNGTGDLESAYNGGENTSYSGSAYAVAKADATVAQFYLKNTIETFTVTSRQFTDSSVQMYTASGALPTNFSVTLAKDGPVTYSSSFQSNRVYYAGTATISNSGGTTVGTIPQWTGVNPNTDTFDVEVTHPIRWAGATPVASDVSWAQSTSIGATCKIMANGTLYPAADNYLVVRAVSGSTITLESTNTAGTETVPVETSSETTYLVPWLPTPCPDTGGILDQRKVQVFITQAPASDEETLEILDFAPLSSQTTKLFHPDNAIDVTSFNIEFDRAITTPALTEMTGDEYPPASYIINEPSVTGSMTLLLRPKDFQYMNSLREDPRRCIGVRIGDTDGRIIEMAVFTAFMEIPTPADADGATQIDIPFTAVRGVECSDVDKFFVRYR